jgi:signal peptidase I
VWLIPLIPLAIASATLFCNVSLIAAGFHIYQIPSTSMEPTLMPGDRIVADLRSYRHAKPRAGELALVRREGLIIVKRVIGEPGSTVEGRNGVVFLNGVPLQEKFIQHNSPQNAPEELSNFGPITIPVGHVFIMGDNRDVSFDSRMFGAIPETDVIGKALYIYRSERDRSFTVLH